MISDKRRASRRDAEGFVSYLSLRASHSALCAALAAGCAASPPPAPPPAPAVYALREEPLRAAACLARNIDRYRSPYSARIRPGEAPAIAEVIVSGSDVVLTAQLFARDDASTVSIRTVQPVYAIDELIAAMIEGC